MTEGYAERRREYVAQIRNSFDTQEKDERPYGTDDTEAVSFSFTKLQFLAAGCILVFFLFLKFTGTAFYGYYANDIIDLVSDNHYYKELKELDLTDKWNGFTVDSTDTSYEEQAMK